MLNMMETNTQLMSLLLVAYTAHYHPQEEELHFRAQLIGILTNKPSLGLILMSPRTRGKNCEIQNCNLPITLNTPLQ